MIRSTIIPVALMLAGLGCAVTPVKPDGSPETLPVDELLKQGARVMWIAAHPDDECFGGSLLARASIHYGNPLYFLVLTHGEGGECGLSRGCHPDLGAVRGEEMLQAAARYRATLQHEHFFNAPLPMSSFPSREELSVIWKKQKDPLDVVVQAILRFKPDLVLTLDPDFGATGHPEHQLTARLTAEALRRAAPQHRVRRMYYVLFRYWALRMIGSADPGPVTETWDPSVPCGEGKSCLDFMLEATLVHRTQHNDMGTVRSNPSAFSEIRLRQVDPYE
jgi:LmbE family N-acetylglucosaminyl deacetylase